MEKGDEIEKIEYIQTDLSVIYGNFRNPWGVC